MIELMLYTSFKPYLLASYLISLVFISNHAVKSCNLKVDKLVRSRHNMFKKSVEISINQVLFSAIRKGKITRMDAMALGWKIMTFPWEEKGR